MTVRRACVALLLTFGLAWACGFSDTMLGFLSANFWLPFARSAAYFERPGTPRVSEPFAGMIAAGGESPLDKLRTAYQRISAPQEQPFDPAEFRGALAAARADRSLTRRQREEIDLIDAKIDMRAGQPDEPALLLSARKKIEVFLRNARTPELLSEARGWLARVHFLLGDQTAAGKIYLDELNRPGSNLSREALLVSLRINYGYDGGPQLLANLEQYFDTPEHAAFAIELVTNPHWHPARYDWPRRFERADQVSRSYARVRGLLEKHAVLLRSSTGSNALAMLTMRVALRMGDPATAAKIGAEVPANAPLRAEPDFLWMLASAHFLSRQFAAAEAPLTALYRSPRASQIQKGVAAYALCGVYRKVGTIAQQLRYAMWLHTEFGPDRVYLDPPLGLGGFLYHASAAGWDLGLLLEIEVPTEALAEFIKKHPGEPSIRLVKYALAVRMTRENRYAEAARLYQEIRAVRRAPRLRRLASLHAATQQPGIADAERHETQYRLADFLVSNSNGIYFNDSLWSGYQSYIFTAANDPRLTRQERETQLAHERKLKDDQEERWRAYLILRGIVAETPDPAMRRKAARLAISSLQGISERFGRLPELRAAMREMTHSVRRP